MSEVKLPEGYKQTEVGVIPKDWDLLPAKEMTSFIGGYSFSSNSAQNNGIRWVKIANVGVNKVKWDAKSYLPYSFAEMHSKYLLKENDVVIALTRPILSESLKIARLSLSDTPSLLNQRVAKLEVTSKGDTNFAYYVLQTSSFVAAMNLAMAGTDPPNIGTKALSKIQVLIPPKQEQTAIATALSDIDNLIQSLEKLIAKKEAIKTGTMQQLLTGKTRLPEFATREDGNPKGFKQTELGQIPEDWEITSIKNITRNIIDYRGVTPRKLGMQWGNGNIVALSAGNVKRGYIDFESECYLGSEALYNRWMTSGDTEKNDIVFTLEAPLGNVALIPDNRKYIMSQRTILLQLNHSKYEPKLIYQIFLSESFMNYISSSATGSTAKGIKRKTFEKLKLIIPAKLEEQTAIATILSDMDKEIQALQQRLDKTHDIKQGMMQQLLTGKVRLVH